MVVQQEYMIHRSNKFDKALTFSYLEIGAIFLFACIPLFLTFPYRVNIFLSWDGAYRMSNGEIPYKDFGMPLGYMYWVIPAIFFKIFGAKLITLIKAQVFINILSGLAFRSILKSLSVPGPIRFFSVLLYCISYTFFNFWPWYNHTVIVYEFIGLAFIMKYCFQQGPDRKILYLIPAGIFIFFSFFTKQDGGGLALLICLCLLIMNIIYEKDKYGILIFISSFLITGFLCIYPFTAYNFSYWFNHGQAPHTSRVSIFDIVDEFLISSQWIKFYLFLIIILSISFFKSWGNFRSDKKTSFFVVLTICILVEASVLQVTSYTPPDNNIFFHSFAFSLIFTLLIKTAAIDFYKPRSCLLMVLGLFLWWSPNFWKYLQQTTKKMFSQDQSHLNTKENIVNRKTFIINRDTTDIPMSEWSISGLRSFDKVYMPRQTINGIYRLLNSDIVKGNKNLQVLNMSELTPLAKEMPYKEEIGSSIPLWYHLGVAMFNQQAEEYETKILQKKYDIVLFEYIPTLNNFYPFRIRDTLLLHYQKIDSFPAPRRGDTKGLIEIYKK